MTVNQRVPSACEILKGTRKKGYFNALLKSRALLDFNLNEFRALKMLRLFSPAFNFPFFDFVKVQTEEFEK